MTLKCASRRICFGLGWMTGFLTLTVLADFSPPDHTGLVLWLKADAGVSTNVSGVVTAWVDQVSALAYTNTSDSPALPKWVDNWPNGTKALRFPTMAVYGLKSPATGVAITNHQARTIFLTINGTNNASGGEIFGSTTQYMIEFSNSTYTNRLRLRDNAINLYSSPGSISWGVPHIIAIRGTADGELRAYLDGTTLLAQAVDAERFKYFFYRLDLPLGVGWSTYLNARSYMGDLAEMVLYDRGLTDPEMKEVIDYLSARYDIPVSYDTAWPLPVIQNREASILIRPDSASLAGELTGGIIADVSLLWATHLPAYHNLSGWLGTNQAPPASLGYVYLNATNLLSETTYYWCYYATNAGGEAWSTVTNAFRTPAARAVPAPPVVNGLALHLSAESISYTNNAVVTWWPDSAGQCPPFTNIWGNANVQYVAAHTNFNNLPAILFNAAAPPRSRIPALTLNRNRTVFLVCKSSGLDNSHVEIIGYDTSAQISTETNRIYIRNSLGRLYTSEGSLPIAPHIVEVTDDVAGTPRTQVWIDGALQDLTYTPGYDGTTRYFAPALDVAAYVGGSGFGSVRSYRGYLAEVLVYDRVLLENEHHRVGVYLQNRYDIHTRYRGPAGTIFILR